jgi:hypothetical protein
LEVAGGEINSLAGEAGVRGKAGSSRVRKLLTGVSQLAYFDKLSFQCVYWTSYFYQAPIYGKHANILFYRAANPSLNRPPILPKRQSQTKPTHQLSTRLLVKQVPLTHTFIVCSFPITNISQLAPLLCLLVFLRLFHYLLTLLPIWKT